VAFRLLADESSKSFDKTSSSLRKLTDQTVAFVRLATYHTVDFTTGIAPGINDARDYCEFATGIEFCIPGQRRLSLLERAASGLGIVLGSGTFWRGVGVVLSGVFVHIGKKAGSLLDSAGKNWDSVQSLLHVVKGNYKKVTDASGSMMKLSGGLHTKGGLDHFIKVNKNLGKNFEAKLVNSLPAVAPDGKILVQKFDNGVRRVLFPRSAMNKKGWNNSGINIDGKFVEGVKTLWPESFTIHDIAEAAKTALAKNKNITGPAKIPGSFKNIKFAVRIDANGLVKTCYPTY